MVDSGAGTSSTQLNDTRKTASEKNNPALIRVGVRGVRLKAFEEVVEDLLPHVTPSFVQLPPLPSSGDDDESNWPFYCLPPSGRVSGNSAGQLTGKRAERKEGQLRSLLRCVVAMLPEEIDDKAKKVTIVDFCGGTGHLAIPLALLLPHSNVVVVDLKAASLNHLHQKASKCSVDSTDWTSDLVYLVNKDVTQHDHIKRQCQGIPNLYTFHGSIESYTEDFDVGVALHACGEASDIVLRACGVAGANFVVSPCCVGKLNRNVLNPYIYHATAGNSATISYPQSQTFSNLLTCSQWDVLAKAADYSDLSELRTARNATRRTAKALLETDRLLYMKQKYGYQTCLSRMDPWESSPKNDILMGWLDGNDSNDSVGSPYRKALCQPCPDCNADVQLSKKHLLSAHCQDSQGDSVDWTWQEEEEIRQVLEQFINSTERKRTFPTGMASRHRKLVHYKAEQMGLAHWCEGKKYALKTVVVAKRNGS